jgi:hypothetical protein
MQEVGSAQVVKVVEQPGFFVLRSYKSSIRPSARVAAHLCDLVSSSRIPPTTHARHLTQGRRSKALTQSRTRRVLPRPEASTRMDATMEHIQRAAENLRHSRRHQRPWQHQLHLPVEIAFGSGAERNQAPEPITTASTTP